MCLNPGVHRISERINKHTSWVIGFDIAWWGSDKGISAQQQLMVQHDDAGWRLAQDAETSVQPRSDEKAILSHVRVLEGAPPLSEYWTLFDTNDEVFNAGRTAQAGVVHGDLLQAQHVQSAVVGSHRQRVLHDPLRTDHAVQPAAPLHIPRQDLHCQDFLKPAA